MSGTAGGDMRESGYGRLWHWFGLSYASWITIPRVLAHEMPDEWQGKMADLLEEYNEATRNPPKDVEDIIPQVGGKIRNRYVKWPDWILRYRHPQSEHLGWIRDAIATQRTTEGR